LNSKLVKLRRAAVYAIGKLDVEGHLSTLTGLLKDEKPSVSREASKALLKKARQIPLEELEGILASSASFHVRRNALTLLLNTDKWRKIPAVLNACADEDPTISGLATRALRDWFITYNRSFAEPTRIDFERIQSVLAKVSFNIAGTTPGKSSGVTSGRKCRIAHERATASGSVITARIIEARVEDRLQPRVES